MEYTAEIVVRAGERLLIDVSTPPECVSKTATTLTRGDNSQSLRRQLDARRRTDRKVTAAGAQS